MLVFYICLVAAIEHKVFSSIIYVVKNTKTGVENAFALIFTIEKNCAKIIDSWG